MFTLKKLVKKPGQSNLNMQEANQLVPVKYKQVLNLTGLVTQWADGLFSSAGNFWNNFGKFMP